MRNQQKVIFHTAGSPISRSLAVMLLFNNKLLELKTGVLKMCMTSKGTEIMWPFTEMISFIKF